MMTRVQPHETRSIAVVGAGVGGLTSAIRLAAAGHRVTVFEKNTGPGGRADVIKDSGYTWDVGPTILLMRDVIEGLFSDVGRNPRDYIDLIQCDPNYRVHFADGSIINFTSNLVRMRDEMERIEPGSFEQYLKFLEASRHHYDASVKHLVSKPLDGIGAYANPKLLATVASVRAHRKLYPWLGKFFKDARLRMALSFQTMYLGISPFDAPATFTLLPYTELAMGIWYPRGGIYQLPLAMERLAKELGVTFRYRTPIERIVVKDGVVQGVRVSGEDVAFDLVVTNADLPYATEKLVPEAAPKHPEKQKFTSSGYMLYLGVDRKYEQLEHHNVLFGDRYRETFKEIFDERVIPKDPAFYVNRPSKTDPGLAPPGGDALYVLVPVPHQTENIDWAVTAPLLRERILDAMEKRLGLTDLRKHIKVEHSITPDDWASRYNLAKGACFGLSHDFWQVGALRPRTRHEKIRNLYFTGASTQPGTGVPLCMLSGKMVAERIGNELPELPRAQVPATATAAGLRDAA